MNELWGQDLPITHQQFVDKIMLFGEPIIQEIQVLDWILSYFQEASSTLINGENSRMYFFNTNMLVGRNLARIMGFQIRSLPVKYLGTPLV